MLPIFFSAYILSACWLTKGNCISYDELKELKTEFAINLYRHVSEAENRTNLVVSPASVAVSLELLQLGAQGNTFTELQDALGYNIHGNVLLKKNTSCLIFCNKFTALLRRQQLHTSY